MQILSNINLYDINKVVIKMNKCNEEFLKRNGINLEEVCQNVDTHIYNVEEINEIVANYNFQGETKLKKVSVADIVGHNEKITTNIFGSLDNFFNENGRGYETRSLSMLEYNKDNIIEGLQKSFDIEPIQLLETGEGNYTVFINGLHRFTVLRALYLSEVANAKGNKEELERLAEKYTIPAKITEIELEKTYCKYLLNRAYPKDPQMDVKRLYNQYDENFNRTGKVIIEYSNGEKAILDNEELMLLTKQRDKDSINLQDLPLRLQNNYNKYKSFRTFMDANFSDLIPRQKEDLEEERG